MENNIKNAFENFPLVNTKEIDPDSNVTTPPEDDVKEVRDWVNHKEM